MKVRQARHRATAALAHSRAAAALSGAKLTWEALPQHMRTQQEHVDRMVRIVEEALESTLPAPAKTDTPLQEIKIRPAASEGVEGGERAFAPGESSA